MKALFLLLLIGYTSFAQDSLTSGTNPLANTLPPPISKYESYDYPSDSPNRLKTETVTSEPVKIELSQNVKDYQYEKEHPSPLKSFEDDKVKFNDYSKPAVATTTHPAQESTDNDTIVKIGGGILALIVVFLTFMGMKSPYGRRVKRY